MDFILPKFTTKALKIIETFIIAALMAASWMLGIGAVKKTGEVVTFFDVLAHKEHGALIDALAIIHLILPILAMLFYWTRGILARRIKPLRKKSTRNTALALIFAVGFALSLFMWFLIRGGNDNCDIVTQGIKGHPIAFAFFYLLAMVEPLAVNYMDRNEIRYGTAATFDGIADSFRTDKVGRRDNLAETKDEPVSEETKEFEEETDESGETAEGPLSDGEENID